MPSKSEKQCLTCDLPLVMQNRRDEGRKHYCSVTCRAKGTASTKSFLASIGRDCLKCGAAFMAKAYRQVYCSKRCQTASASMRLLLRQNTIEHYLGRLAWRSGRRLSPKVLVDMWIAQGGKCALTGQAMTHELGVGRQHRNASLDRIDPNLGYVIGNMQLVCFAANLMKQDFSTKQLRDWCELVLKESCHAIENS